MDKIKISDILKIRKHRYFDNTVSNYRIINRQIYFKTLILMCNVFKNKGCETLLMMDNISYNYEITTNNRLNKVFLSTNMKNALKFYDSTFTCIHNHPSNNSFSIGDLYQLIQNPKITLLILCTNNCKYNAALYKSKVLSRNDTLDVINKIDEFKQIHNLTNNSGAFNLLHIVEPYGIYYLTKQNY